MIQVSAAVILLLSFSAPLPEADSRAEVETDGSRTVARLAYGPAERAVGLPEGLYGYSVPGCTEMDGLLMPVEHLYVAVPPTGRVEVSARPLGGGRSLPAGRAPAGFAVGSCGEDSVFAAAAADVSGEWAVLRDVSRFRGIRMASVDVYPVIRRQDGLVSAEAVELTVTYPEAGRPTPADGLEGRFYSRLLLAGNSVWPLPRPAGREDSPFWGRPWAEVGLDTTGVYVLSGGDVPDAVGQPSATLAMYRGRGRMMGYAPWENAYQPIPVPLLVEDGGDGVFDSSDRIVFFGTGLSWWEPDGQDGSGHYTSRFDSLNSHWLTWGGQGGIRMDTLDGGLTGAPAMPDSFQARIHLEEEYFWLPRLPDSWWAWFKVYGSTPGWLDAAFDGTGAVGPATVRVGLVAETKTKVFYGETGVEVYLNGELVADTLIDVGSSRVLEVPVSNVASGPNAVSVKIWRETGNDDAYLDWLEVLPWSRIHGGGQQEVPLSWYREEGRRRFDSQGSLQDAYVLYVERDSTASLVSPGSSTAFELDVGELGTTRSVWISPETDLMSPASVQPCSPGRIMGTLDGAERVFICHPEFAEGVLALDSPTPSTAFVTTEEIYDEFNGGVRDPQAIRAFLEWTMQQWDPRPMEVVLVGEGNYDIRGFNTNEITYVPVVFGPGYEWPYDDYYAILQGSDDPQLAMSRICASDGQELAVTVEKSLAYREGDAAGDWQRRVIGVADDERGGEEGSWGQISHTLRVEAVMEESVPDLYLPVKCYEIFFDWNQQWRKPEARQDLIEQWSRGALMIGFKGHGGYNQIYDEGILFLEDVDLLACGRRLPYSYFGSCSVGEFYKPDRSCLAQAVVTVPGGGSVVSSGAVSLTGATWNYRLFESQAELVLDSDPEPFDICLLLAKLDAGYNVTTKQYVMFGDGTVTPAVPDTLSSMAATPLRTGESAELTATSSAGGLAGVVAFESAAVDTYYTYNDNTPIPYVRPYRTEGPIPGVETSLPFYTGSAPAEGLELSMFVPVDADTGSRARVDLFVPQMGGLAGALYPEPLEVGDPVWSDSSGPSVDIWIAGFQGEASPEVSTDPTVVADLSDESGINLLSEPGRQLTLYVDDVPQPVASDFSYDPGSATSGRLETQLSGLAPGAHGLRLRAADGLNNIAYGEMTITVLEGGAPEVRDVFVYPNPCSGRTAVSWTQTVPAAVELRIYTVSGRPVRRVRGIPGEAGYNQVCWDCRDDDGDPVASGSYVYLLRVETSADGEASAETGVIAVVR